MLSYLLITWCLCECVCVLSKLLSYLLITYPHTLRVYTVCMCACMFLCVCVCMFVGCARGCGITAMTANRNDNGGKRSSECDDWGITDDVVRGGRAVCVCVCVCMCVCTSSKSSPKHRLKQLLHAYSVTSNDLVNPNVVLVFQLQKAL